MVKIQLALVIVLVSCSVRASKQPPYQPYPNSDPKLFKPFPRKIWAYWDSGLTNAMVWTHLCINNMRHFAQQSGWQFFFLTNQNYTNYLSPTNAAKIQDLFTIRSTYRFTQVSKSDLIRVFLLLQNGGVWIDANSFFIADLSWLDRLFEHPYVYNRFFPDPQLLMFTYNQWYSGNKTVIWDHQLNRSIYLHPGFENWFIVAKPNCTFLQDVANGYQIALRQGKRQTDIRHQKAGVIFHREKTQYMWMGNYQFIAILQLKQKQLDLAHSSTKYAIEHYGIWTIEAQHSGLQIHLNFELKEIQTMIWIFSYQEMEDAFDYEIVPMFVKIVGWVSKNQEKYLQNFYKKNCTLEFSRITKTSLAYKYLINISSMFPEVDQMKKTLNFMENPNLQECGQFSKPIALFQSLTDHLQQIVTQVIKILVYSLLLITFVCSLNTSDKIQEQ